MDKLKSPLILFLVTVACIALIAVAGPEDKALGANVRIVYLHGAWVLTAEIAFAVAAITGAVGLLAPFAPFAASRAALFLRWSESLGRAGIFFWVTYLPLSMWAMQSNWNGLFLAEPRFRLAVTFAVVGALLQVGLRIINNKLLTAAANIAFIVVLRVIFSTAANVLHPPPSPIFNSGNYTIIGFFVGLNLLSWLAAFFLTRWFLSLASE